MEAGNRAGRGEGVLDEVGGRVGGCRVSSSVRDVVDREQDAGQQLQNDDDENHPAEAVIEGVGEVGDALVHRLVDGFRKGIALVEPLDDRKLDLARVWDGQASGPPQKPRMMPSTSMVFASWPCFQVRCESA